MEAKKRINDYFNANKSIEVVYETSDGFLFGEKQFAIRHAETLDEGKRDVETFKNPLTTEVVAEIVEVTGLTAEQKELLEAGLVKENYNDLKALVKVLKIETTDQKAETLIKALENYKVDNK